MKTAKARETLLDRSEIIASWSNADRELHGLYHRAITLYRHRDGRYFAKETGGGAMTLRHDVKWLSDDEAADFVRIHCSDPVTGYGYTEAEIVEVLAGGDPRGTSDRDMIRPDFCSL
jgi:hypothetical protein